MPRAIKPRVFLSAALVAATLSLPVLAQEKMPPAPRQVDSPNAALLYWPAWSMISRDTAEKMRAVKWAEIGAETDASKLPRAFTDAAAFDILEPVANDLVVASKAARCDFEIRYDEGFMALMPHLSHQRSGACLLRVAARQKLTRGDADGAAEYVCAIVRSGNHLAGDRVLISTLVAYVSGTMACEEARAIVASGKLSAKGRDELLAMLRTLDTPDPMGIRSTLAFEGQVIPSYFERTYHGPKAGDQIATLLSGFAESTPDPATADAVRALDEAGLKKELGRVRGVYEEIYAAWKLDGDAAGLKAINERVISGAYGPLARLLCPSLEKSFGKSQDYRRLVKETIAQVERYIPKG